MAFEILAQPAAFLVFLTAFVLLISRDWRLSVGALAVQYAGVLVLVGSTWPIETAVVKLVAGWMAGAVIGIAMLNSPEELRSEEKFNLSAILFRLFAAVLAGLVAFTWGGKIFGWIPEISLAQASGGLVLILMGLLQLGLTDRPLRVILGLLTFLAGFEVLSAGLESSALLTGLLALFNLSLAMAGAYLIAAPQMGEPD